MPAARLLLLVALALCLSALAGCGQETTTIAFTGTAAPPPPPPIVAASGKATLKATEFAFGASEIDAKPGKLAITLENVGSMPHELVLLKTDAAPGSLPGMGGRVAEAGSVGTLSPTQPSRSRTKTFDLKPGRYIFLCNIVGHYASGMRGQLVVK
jgi:plastocyanin